MNWGGLVVVVPLGSPSRLRLLEARDGAGGCNGGATRVRKRSRESGFRSLRASS